MQKLTFTIIPTDEIQRDRGINTIFTDGNGHSTTSWWSAPPKSLDHTDKTYLQNRHPNIKSKKHVQFIQNEFKKQLTALSEYTENHYSKEQKLELSDAMHLNLKIKDRADDPCIEINSPTNQFVEYIYPEHFEKLKQMIQTAEDQMRSFNQEETI